jgi:hypothetical protein
MIALALGIKLTSIRLVVDARILPDIGLDIFHPFEIRHGDTVMADHNIIRLPDLINGDWRPVPVLQALVDTSPLVAKVLLQRAELAIEITAPANTSCDRRNGNGLDAKVLASSLQAERVIFEILQKWGFP